MNKTGLFKQYEKTFRLSLSFEIRDDAAPNRPPQFVVHPPKKNLLPGLCYYFLRFFFWTIFLGGAFFFLRLSPLMVAALRSLSLMCFFPFHPLGIIPPCKVPGSAGPFAKRTR